MTMGECGISTTIVENSTQTPLLTEMLRNVKTMGIVFESQRYRH